MLGESPRLAGMPIPFPFNDLAACLPPWLVGDLAERLLPASDQPAHLPRLPACLGPGCPPLQTLRLSTTSLATARRSRWTRSMRPWSAW